MTIASTIPDLRSLRGTLALPATASPQRPLLRVGLVCLLVGFLLLPIDAAASAYLASFAPPRTLERFIVRLPYPLFGPLAYPVITLVLLIAANRWRLLIGFALACLAVAAPVHLAKFAIGRLRPEAGLGPYAFEPLSISSLSDSLPSGHTAGAVLITVLVATYLPRSQWVFAPLAAMVALARIAQERHFVSDVLLGAGLTLAILALLLPRLGPTFFHPIQLQGWGGRLEGGAAVPAASGAIHHSRSSH